MVKVLIFDIETSPNEGLAWGKYEQTILKVTKHWEMLSVAYKWLGDKGVQSFARPDYKDKTEKSLVKDLWDLFDKADVILAHNGDNFDIKKSKTKFLKYGLKPPTPYKTLDTKKIAKSQFGFISNSLNDLGDFLGLGKKHETGGIQLWIDCMAGDKKAWKKMVKYNEQDVLLLEKVYTTMRAWHTTHPNLPILEDRIGCPVCKSVRVSRQGVRIAVKRKYTRFQCQECGHWFQGELIK